MLILQKKRYYSEKRKKDIIFDVSIECCRKGSDQYSQLIIIECKDYSSSIPVDDVEEFESKLRQVAGVNVKGMFFSRSSFQISALNFAKSSGMALVRVLPDNQVEWILERKPLSSSLPERKNEDQKISIQALLDNDYIGLSQNIFNYYNNEATSSFPEIFNKLAFTNSDLDKYIPHRKVASRRDLTKNTLSYISYDDLDSKTLEILTSRINDTYPLDLSLIMSDLAENHGVLFDLESDLGSDQSGNKILGVMDVKRNVIKITNKLEHDSHSWRFALAHEIGHYMLHSGYILNLYGDEYNEVERNLSWGKEGTNKKNTFNRLEWQANAFANCILMPKYKVHALIAMLVKELDITNFSNGVIYLDDQPCNNHHYQCIISKLKKEFNVSASIATIRLKQLRILNDVRKVQSVNSLIPEYYKK